MANRDFTKIERIMKDFSQNIGGSGSGGMVVVDKLPEKGNTDTLYRTSDGIYEWYHTEEKVPVYKEPDLNAGGVVTFKEELTRDRETFENFENLTSANYNIKINYEEEPTGGTVLNRFITGSTELDEHGQGRLSVGFILGWEESEEPPYAGYSIETGGIIIDDTIALHKEYLPEGPVQLTIYQEVLDAFEEAGLDIQDLAFMFEGGIDHYDTIVDEGYIKVFGTIQLEASKMSAYRIYLDDKNYDAKMIYNTVLNGGAVELISESGEDFANVSLLKSYNYSYDSFENCDIMNLEFNNSYWIEVYLKNQHEWAPATYTGQEIMDKIGADSCGFFWINARDAIIAGLMDFLSPEEQTKTIPNGETVISLFDGAVSLKVFYSSGEAYSTNVYSYIKLLSQEEPFETQVFSSLDYSSDTFEELVNGVSDENDVFFTPNEVFDPTKDYSTDIIITFADGSTKTVPTTTDFIEYTFVGQITPGPLQA